MRAVVVPGLLGAVCGIAALGCNILLGYDEGDPAAGAGADAGDVPCNEDPWSCDDSQTCWIFTDGAFHCIAAGTQAAGSPCTATIGSPQCAPGLFCYAVPAPEGVCAPFCDPLDPAKSCSNGTCVELSYRTPDGGTLPSLWGCAP